MQAGLPAWNATEYAKRLAAQERGALVQVVTWMGERPVGKAMVLFPANDEYSVSAEREGCGEIRDATVAPDARRLGVATAMIAALETAVRERGLSRTGPSSRARTSTTTTGGRSASGHRHVVPREVAAPD